MLARHTTRCLAWTLVHIVVATGCACSRSNVPEAPEPEATPGSSAYHETGHSIDDRGAADGRRRALRELLRSGSPEAPAALVDATADPSTRVRAEAAYQLGHTKHPRALELLEQMGKDPDPPVRAMVVEGLAELGGPGARASLLRWAVADTSVDVRSTAADALGVLGRCPETVAALCRLREDAERVVDTAAVRAIERLGASCGR